MDDTGTRNVRTECTTQRRSQQRPVGNSAPYRNDHLRNAQLQKPDNKPVSTHRRHGHMQGTPSRRSHSPSSLVTLKKAWGAKYVICHCLDHQRDSWSCHYVRRDSFGGARSTLRSLQGGQVVRSHGRVAAQLRLVEGKAAATPRRRSATNGSDQVGHSGSQACAVGYKPGRRRIVSNNIEAPPGWYVDPNDARLYRWWNGTLWTAQSSPVAGAPIQLPPGGKDSTTAYFVVHPFGWSVSS